MARMVDSLIYSQSREVEREGKAGGGERELGVVAIPVHWISWN